jgi:hypothetical protein
MWKVFSIDAKYIQGHCSNRRDRRRHVFVVRGSVCQFAASDPNMAEKFIAVQICSFKRCIFMCFSPHRLNGFKKPLLYFLAMISHKSPYRLYASKTETGRLPKSPLMHTCSGNLRATKRYEKSGCARMKGNETFL